MSRLTRVLGVTLLAVLGFGLATVAVGSTWQYVASMTYKRDKLGGATGLDGTIYAICGMPDPYTTLDVLEAYDADTDIWTTKSPCPTPTHSFASATGADGKIYVIGGFVASGLTNKVYAYDPATDAWSQRSSMSKARDFPGAAMVDGKIYAIGGGRTTYNGHLVEMYDPATNTWSVKSPMPTSRYAMGVVAVDGKIYVIGGGLVWTGTAVTTVEVYDPATDTWSTKSPMPAPRYRFGATLGADGKIYVIGGASGGGSLVNTVYAYDPATDTWSSAPSLPSQRWDQAAATGPNGKIYAIGGYSYNPYGRTNTVLAYITEIPNSPPTVDAGGPYPVDEGGSVTVTAVGEDPDSDPLTYEWDLDYDGTFETPGQSVPFSAAGLDGPSTQTIAVKVTDTGGLFATDEATVNVVNVAPTVGAIVAPVDPVQVNTEITASADFTDPGILDTHTGVWNWGDETTSEATIIELEGSGTATGTHPYTATGVYTVTLTVYDDDGDVGESVFQYVVVYDPTAGFVTGGGWITSPPGAYVPDPSFTGKANFGFVAKYRKGTTVPTGNTQFSFDLPEAGFEFHSTEYQWLVIAGARAMFKGYGTVNDEGEYGFMLTAVDGALPGGGGQDKFRIKIWDKASELIVYDNLLGLPDESDPQPIDRGSIVIHSGGPGNPQWGWIASRNPMVFALHQNQPNPFHGSTKIHYSLPVDREVSIRIYDTAGRVVRTLVEKRQESGFYEAQWDGTNTMGEKVTTGIYLARLVAGDFSSVKKMVLLR